MGLAYANKVAAAVLPTVPPWLAPGSGVSWPQAWGFPGPPFPPGWEDNDVATPYWCMDETTGDPQDESNSNFHLTEVGTVPSDASGILGAARGPYSTSNYFTEAYRVEYAIKGGWSVWVWFKTSGAISTPEALVAKANNIDADVAADDWSLHIIDVVGTKNIRMSVNSGGASASQVQNSGTWTDGNWHFAGINVNSDNSIDVYTDGTHTTSPGPATIGTQSTTLGIGVGALNDGTSPFSGSLDCMGFAKFAMTKADWDFVYNNGTGRSLL